MVKSILASVKLKSFTYEDISEVVARVIGQLDSCFNRSFDSVVIKPNLCYYWDYSTGETTDPRVVSALIDSIRDRLGSDVDIVVAEADASAMRTKHAFKMLGYEELSERKKVKLVNLSKGDVSEREVLVKGKKLRLKVNRLLSESNLIINVPKLKYHRFVGSTCGLKNMFGAISTPRKYIYHQKIAQIIVGINKLVKSDLTLVDGIIAKGEYPKKMGVLVASTSIVAADHTAAQVLGFNPDRIAHINLAKKENVDNIENIELVEDGISLKEVQEMFPNPNYYQQKVSWTLQLKMLNAYSRIVGDIIPPVLK